MRFLTFGAGFDRPEKPVSDHADFRDQRLETNGVIAFDEATSERQNRLRVQLAVRAEGNFEVMQIAGRPATMTFRDVGRDRDCTFAHLVSQTESFSRRKILSEVVDQVGELERLL